MCMTNAKEQSEVTAKAIKIIVISLIVTILTCFMQFHYNSGMIDHGFPIAVQTTYPTPSLMPDSPMRNLDIAWYITSFLIDWTFFAFILIVGSFAVQKIQRKKLAN